MVVTDLRVGAEQRLVEFDDVGIAGTKFVAGAVTADDDILCRHFLLYFVFHPLRPARVN